MMIVIMIVTMVVVAALLLQLKDSSEPGKALEKLLPVYKVERDCILAKNGDLTIALQLELPEIFSLSSDEYETLHQIWVRAMKLLPPGVILHKQDWFTEEQFQPDFVNSSDSFFNSSSDRFFNERPVLEHHCYLMITRRAGTRPLSNAVFSNLLRPSLVAPGLLNEQEFLDFNDKVSQFSRLLSEGGFIKVIRLTDDQLAGSPQQAGLIERYCFLLHAQQAPMVRDICFKPELRIGENLCQLYTISSPDDLPGLCGSRLTYDKYSSDKAKFPIGFAASVGQLLSCNHIYNQFVVIEDTQKTLKKLETKRRRLQSLSAYSRENAIAREATNSFLNEAISQGRLPVKAHFNIMVWSSDADRQKELRNMASAALAQMDVVPRQTIKGAPQTYWCGLPGNAGALPANETFDTFAEQASCFFIQETTYKDSVSPFGVRLVDRQMGKPIHVDITDEPMRKGWISNRNKVVFGASGSGKSMFMCHLMRSYFELGAHAVIVDVGHSYEGLCQLVGGYYFTYDEKNPLCFNPFFIDEGDTLDTEKKESIKSLLVALWKKDDESFKRSEYVALSNALHRYFEYIDKNPAVFPCFDSFYDFLRDQYAKVLSQDGVKEKDFDFDNFLYVLRPFYGEGEYGFLLNARNRLDLFHQRFIVFELDSIKDHPILFPLVTIIIMELFVSKMRKLKGIRKVITIEEAWKAIAKSGMAEFMRYLYKTVRKFFGEAITVSQEVDDALSSPVVKEAILNNADTKILLDMRKFQNKFDQLQSVMGMPDKGKPMVLSLNKANDPKRRYREVYIDHGGVSMKVYGYEPSPQEYYAYTTEEKEKVLVKQFTAQCGGDMKKGIQALIAHQAKASA
ncbi:TraG family conjugative transposon ATPase [Chitinophaga filiformis]|uniref:TraG family conjugative transposon ATPase n=1 Tax=Chitinophaga filiformis TaxID=104663 RepID=A0ABY4HW64_CHIFI|nr:TraG family conjugative transposon ATPase [Chitinophaga filiformis]UPK68032.1 TraG family conjugative transposon ATPase [Chitinophaga filiformis]